KDKADKEQAEKEKAAKEQAEKDKAAKEQAEEKAAKEQAEKDRAAKEREDREREERERTGRTEQTSRIGKRAPPPRTGTALIGSYQIPERLPTALVTRARQGDAPFKRVMPGAGIFSSETLINFPG